MTTRRNTEPVPEVGAYRTGNHMYYFDGAGPWVGVTTATDVLDKPALTNWKREQVAIAAVKHAPRLMEDRASGNDEAAVAFLLKARDAGTDGRERGSRIHTAIEHVLRHEDPRKDKGWKDDDSAALEGARAWLNQQALEHGLRPLEVESYMLNPTIGYAGTVDLIAELDGEVWILDWKSGKSVASPKGRVYDEMRLQLAAYAHAEFIGRPADSTRYPVPAITRYGVVHVTDGGTRLYDAHANMPAGWTPERDWTAFRACLHVHQWIQEAGAYARNAA